VKQMESDKCCRFNKSKSGGGVAKKRWADKKVREVRTRGEKGGAGSKRSGCTI